MTPEQLSTAIQLALYRVSDRMRREFPQNEDVIGALRRVADEIGDLTAVPRAVAMEAPSTTTTRD